MQTLSRLWYLVGAGGRPAAGRLAHWRSVANGVIRRAPALQSLSDSELTIAGRDLRWRAKSGVPLSQLLPEAFALVREASRRARGMEHFAVQMMGGMALFEGGIAEMQTGEGKTLTAVLTAYLRALEGQGVHVITVNDYLARRDAETMGPIYQRLGLTVGCVQEGESDDDRRAAYARDITYGTAKEFGFDFLRDRLKKGTDTAVSRPGLFSARRESANLPVQRGHHFALIDEADSILIDEARTPLIIALNQPNDPATVSLYRWANTSAQKLLLDVDYLYEPDKRAAYLTDQGCRKVTLMQKPGLLDSIDMPRMFDQLERALVAHLGFKLDRDYVIDDDKIVIVDESTGRMMDGRKWQDGLHQAVEAKERVSITAATGQAARITVQSFFRHYAYLAGMTGTAVQVRGELSKTYKLRTTVVPTHRHCIRRGLPTRVFHSLDAKMQAVALSIKQIVEQGRAVLVGTPSVEKSERLGAVLKELGMEHKILNAKFHDIEADIVKDSGQVGHVTIATNMAGRGTDIMLSDSVRKNGGLHVIATEMHSSARIDRQLIGRAARQGDPGTFQFFLSLDDELLRCLGAARVAQLKSQASPGPDGTLSTGWIALFRKTQRMLEREHSKQRRNLLKAEKQRTELYEKMGLDPFLEMTE